MKRMVPKSFMERISRASAIASRNSETPEVTADAEIKCILVALAIIRASVVFPTPGGPQSIIDGTWSSSIALFNKRF